MIALIFARGGSKRVPRKNVLMLGNHPLIAYPIMEAKKVVEKVYVSTDDQEISDIAKLYGAEVIIRPSRLTTDSSGELESFKHFIDITNYSGDILQLRATTPLIKESVLKDIISYFYENESNCTSLRSGHETSECVFKYFVKNDIYWNGIASNMGGEYYNKPSQSLPKTYSPNGYADIIKTSTIKNGYIHGDKILAYLTEFVPEVDSYMDFEFLQFYYKKYFKNSN
jgi:CMP-N-acetylneuraminic acid synthetase